MDVYDTEVADRDAVVRGSSDPGSWDEIPRNLRPDRKGPVWPFVLAGFMFLVGAAVTLVLLFPFDVPYYSFSPGPVNDVTDFIAVDDAAAEGSGELFFLTVSLKEVNVIEYIGALIDREVDLSPRENVRPVGVSQEDLRQQNLALMQASQDSAKFVALTQLGYEVTLIGSGAQVQGIVEGSAAVGNLLDGDLIVAVDGTSVSFVDEAVGQIGGRAPGDEVVLSIRRIVGDDNVVEELDVAIVLGPFRAKDEDGNLIEEPDRGMVGVLLTSGPTETVFPVDITIDSNNIGGPSAGLMFTLEIMNQLTEEDITKGQSIAGTGTISRDGTVGAIGGIKQKVFGAIDAGANFVLVPTSNYPDALEAAGDDIEVIEVATIADALAFLETL
ncbi:MAG: PDZ domain-containing protein [bacterium]|nr:PDZ domain-containing protein [bacterium]